MLVYSKVQRVPMTREEYLRRAEVLEECLRDWEEGEAIRLMPAKSSHNRFMVRLTTRVEDHLRATGGGQVWADIFIDFGARIFAGDLVALFPDRLDAHRNERVYGAPSLVVEVISEDSAHRDRVEKFDYYQQQGLPWYWIGDPVAIILEEYRNTPEGYVRTASGDLEHPFHPKALPGMVIDLRQLVED